MARAVMVAWEKSGHSAVPQHKTDWGLEADLRCDLNECLLCGLSCHQYLPEANFLKLQHLLKANICAAYNARMNFF